MLDWSAVRARYTPGTELKPLSGGSVLRVDGVDDEQVCLKQRLWRACVTRAQLETALRLLDGRRERAIPFTEELRTYYSQGPDAITDCTRIPNLTAVVLLDLGYLDPG